MIVDNTDNASTAPQRGSRILGNYIGTNAEGTAALGNGANGVFVFGSSYNTIGGPGDSGNLISGNLQSGIFLYSATNNARADSNLIIGNDIGTDRNGMTAIPNNADGVQIVNGNLNTIYDNVLSGNLASGINITAISDSQVASSKLTASNNFVDGNIIGPRADGLGTLSGSTQQIGVTIQDASGNFIGSGNRSFIGYTNVPDPNHKSNVISGNVFVGVQINGISQSNAILGNYIGTDSLGQSAIANRIGVFINNTTGSPGSNVIGGSDFGSGNIISGNTTAGIELFGPDSGSNPAAPGVANLGGSSTIQGNLIGLGFADTVGSQFRAIGNAQGILVQGSSLNLIGGDTAPERNVISGNSDSGILITGTSLQNRIAGNYIGTNPAGGASILNDSGAPIQTYGVQLSGNAFNNTVGSGGTFTDPGANVISGNDLGIGVNNIAAGPDNGTRNLIQGNLIGVTPEGTAAASNAEYGIFVNNSPYTLVQSNLTSANEIAGIGIFGNGATHVTVVANVVGPDLFGRPVFQSAAGRVPGAQLYGVVVIGASSNTIGTSNAGNLISGNSSVGVYISRQDFFGNTYSIPTNNLVFGNTITQNRQYGILFYNAPSNVAPPFTGSGRQAISRRRRAGSNTNIVFGNGVSFLNYVTQVNGNSRLRRSPRRQVKPASQVKPHAHPQVQAKPIRVIMPNHS
jgi:hypothetical protein